ncbi:TatD family hydrolase [Senegalimassilia anaerobia]|uniref:TatD family hydrolase n=1 Tax=Senegalimassilia anaerobia TaxID=1473216 RepID=UPI003AB964DA
MSMDEPAYFDMHCHLGFCEDAVQAARALAAAGVGAFSNTVTPAEFAEQQAVLADAVNVRVGAGLHPWWVGEYDVAANWDRLYSLVARNRFIGEVGLDLSPRRADTREAQLDALACVAHACARTGRKVLSVHAVRAVDQVLDVLEHASVFGGLTGNACIIHWFSGTSDQLTRARRVGCYFSVNPRMLDSKRGRAYAQAIPADRLLLETDEPASEGAPWSAARVRGSLEETLTQLAALRGDDPAQLREQIAQTSRTLLQQ